MASMFTGQTKGVWAAGVAVGLAVLLGGAYVVWPRENQRLSCLQTVPDDGPHPGMVWVPGGTFEMGDTVYPEEQPRRTVSVEGFWMDRTEVTNAQFAAFVAATGYVTVAERPVDRAIHPEATGESAEPGAVVFLPPAPNASLRSLSSWWRYTPGANWRHPGGPTTTVADRDHFPVTGLAFEDVIAYANWAGRTLPTEAQWEWAARAGATGNAASDRPPSEANTWQGVFPVINTNDDGFLGVAPVGCFPANAFGLHDMIGNLWEWTADIYREPTDTPSPVSRRVIKGGSFLCAANYCMRYRSAARQGQEEDLATSHLGFRTILNAPGPKR